MKDPKVKMELTREDGHTHQTSVIRKVRDYLPETNDKYCQSCTTSSERTYGYSMTHAHTVTCTCHEDRHDAEDAIRMVSFTHYERLNAGDSVYLKSVSGGAWVGETSKFIFSGEFISE